MTAGAIGSTEIYNPMTDTWSESTDLPTPISDGGLATGTNGNLFLLGGENRLTVRKTSDLKALFHNRPKYDNDFFELQKLVPY